MQAITLTVTCFVLLLGLGADIATAHQAIPDYHAMKEAYHAGRLSAVDYVNLVVQAMNDPTSLDAEWLTDQRRPEFCLTPIIRDVERAARHDAEAQAALLLLRSRPTKQASIVSPDGLFTIHYDTSGTHAVRDPDVDIDPADGIPDFVNLCAEIFDYSWHVEVDTLGYDPPGSDYGLGGSDNYDVYMHKEPEGYAGWVQIDPGLAPPEYPERPGAVCSHIWVDPTFEDVDMGEGFEPIGLLKTTAAYLLFAAVECVYDWAFSSAGWATQTCMWAMDIVYDDVNWHDAYFPFFFPYPHVYLYSDTPFYFPYGACVWPFFLEDRFGMDVIRQIWVECIPAEIDGPQAVDIVLQGLGSSQSEAVAEFRVWNYFTGERDDGLHYEEGADWPLVHIMTEHTEFPVIDATPIEAPQGLACNYIECRELEEIDHLRFVFSDENSYPRDWAVNFILLKDDSSECVPMEIDNGGGETIFFTEETSTIVMVPTSLENTSSHCYYSYSVWANEYVILEEFSTEDQGDGDGRLEAGETFSLGASFYSIAVEWENACLTVSTDDPDLEIIQDQATGESASPGDTFEFPVGSILLSVANDLQEAHTATMELHVGPAGAEPLRTFEVDILLGIPHYLLVDDDGGDIIESYVEATFDSLGLLYDVWDDHEGMFLDYPLADLELDNYDSTIIWITGDAGNHLNEDDMDRIESMLMNGGHLLLSGQDIAESLATTPEGAAFMANVLGVQFDGYESSHMIRGSEGDPMFDDTIFVTSGIGMDGANNQNSQDRLNPENDVQVCLDYQTGYPAAVRREWRTGRLIFAGFGIEAIVDDNSNFASRRYFLNRALDWLNDGVDTDRAPLPTEIKITRVWPNPSSGVFHARSAFPGTLSNMKVSLVDLAGRRVTQLFPETPWDNDHTIVTFRIPDAVSNGIYLIRVSDPETSQIIPIAIIR